MFGISLNDSPKGVTVFRDGEPQMELAPDELMELAQALQSYAVESADQLPEEPTRVIRFDDLEYRVHVSPYHQFWNSVDEGHWEPETFEVFDRYIDGDTVVLDIGAWIGPTSLYAAQKAKSIHAFEPDPAAFEVLEKNLQANADQEWKNRLRLHPIAVSPSKGTCRMGSRHEAGDSMSSTLLADSAGAWMAEANTLQGLIAELQLEDEHLFVKMDIEGGEYKLLPAIRSVIDSQPCVLCISFHPGFLMEKLSRTINGFLPRLRRRIIFCWQHWRVVRSLSSAQLTYFNGRPFRARKELLKAFLSGEFPQGLIAQTRACRIGK